MKPWQKLAIISACGGAALALVIALVAGGYLWYEARPKPPKPWNNTAVKASFDYLSTEGKTNTFDFCYTLQNTTPRDYEVDNRAELSVAGRLLREKSLSFESDGERFVRPDLPIFIPSGQRLRFVIHLDYPYPGKDLPSGASAEDRKKYREALNKFVNENLTNLNGFVLFDKTHHYEIVLPKGW